MPALLASAHRDGFEAVWAVGGDGTVHEIAKRLTGSPMALGILPTGSGNGLAHHLGISSNPATALRSAAASRVVEADTVQIGDDRFIGVMGLGFDAAIAHRFATAGTRGLRTYLRAGISAFHSFAPEQYELEVDGRLMTRNAFVVAIANSAHYGNHARIAPEASMTDGMFDLVLVDDFPLTVAPLMLLRLFRGTFHQSHRVTTVRARDLVLRRPAAGPAHMDGEAVTLPAVIHARIDPRSLRLLVPATRDGDI